MLSAILKQQFAGEEQLPPFRYHVRDTIVDLEDGRVAFAVRAKGVPFEVSSDEQLENQYNSLNELFVSLAKAAAGRVAVWVHLDHYETEFSGNYKFSFEWMRDFNSRYMAKFKKQPIFENDFYLTFVLKPGMNDSLAETIREAEGMVQTVAQSLKAYDCEVLSSYERDGHLFSEFYEFIAYLYNGFWEPVPVTSLPLFQAVESSYLHHGYRCIETRRPDGSNRFAAYSDLKDFPPVTTRGRLNPLLQLPFPFLLGMSLTLLTSSEALRMLGQALNWMNSAGDQADEQQLELEAAKGAVMSGEVVFGEFHAALAVFGGTEKQAEDRATAARTAASGSCATRFVAAAMSAPETFFSMFPGNTKRRPRTMPKTTRSLLGLFSMNNYSSGKAKGNPIGDGTAVMPLRTSVNGVYHLNFHYSRPGVNDRGAKRAGHTLILGVTGTGKTTAQTVALAHLERFDFSLFAIDKDGSMRGMVEALGGTYLPLTSGVPTGLAPFQLPDTPMTRSFLYDLVEACGRKGDANRKTSAEDSRDIKLAVDNIFELPFEHRRFGALLLNIPDRGEDCLARRLADWCYGETDGRYAYALDNPTNAFDWKSFKRVGFDVTDFLVDGHPATEPILSYLLFLKKLMQQRQPQGGVMVTVVEEYWAPCKYPTTARQIEDVIRVGRRRGEFIVLVSQSPDEAMGTPLMPLILQQTATKVLLPNPEAVFKTEDGGGYWKLLSPKEFETLVSLDKESRMFLVKQGSQSAVARLDLEGMGDDIAVLAMAAEDFPLLEAAKAQAGQHPDQWVPAFKALRREAHAKDQSTTEGATS